MVYLVNSFNLPMMEAAGAYTYDIVYIMGKGKLSTVRIFTAH